MAAAALQSPPSLDRKPKALSGGQRAAVGRPIVRDPQDFLFGEALPNLAAALRARRGIELTKLQRKLGATMIQVTRSRR